MKIRFSAVGVKRPPIEREAARGIRLALREGRVPSRATEMNVIWVRRDHLRKLNQRFRHTRRYTDVIAFRYPPPDLRRSLFVAGSSLPFGDLYISPEEGRRYARQLGHRPEEEWIRLAVHGTLHLLGYTDYTPRPRARMWARQEPIVRRVAKRFLRRP